MSSNTSTTTPTSCQLLDERSPNTTSSAIPIPNKLIYKPLPPILLDSDTTPGTIHHGRASITDYTCWHYPSHIARDEERITSHRAPPFWVNRVGMAPPPGFELRKVERKDVEIVAGLRSPWDNLKEVNRLRWLDERRKECREKSDSGYESLTEERPVKAACVTILQEGNDSDFSVWSC